MRTTAVPVAVRTVSEKSRGSGRSAAVVVVVTTGMGGARHPGPRHGDQQDALPIVIVDLAQEDRAFLPQVAELVAKA